MRLFVLIVNAFVVGLGSGWFAHGYKDGRSVLSVANQPKQLPRQLTPGSPLVHIPIATDELDTYLNQHDRQQLDEYLASVSTHGSEDEQEHVRMRIFAFAKKMHTEQQYDLAASVLQSYRLSKHRDVDVLMLLADISHANQAETTALDYLYEAKGYAFRQNNLDQIVHKIRTLVAGYAKQLAASQQEFELLEFYEYLSRQEPEYSPYFIELARIQIHLSQPLAASRSLQLVALDPRVGMQARAMLADLAAMEQSDAEEENDHSSDIPLQREGQHFIVTVEVNGRWQARLLIDTGATLTILTPDFVQQSGLSLPNTSKTGRFSTANGSVRAPVFEIDSLAVASWQVNSIEVGVLPLGNGQSIDGLLGMNFLQYFQFFIDQRSAVLRLSRR
ncbi:MAG: retropepsin-like aspartic protease [Gammaproteobacteria bacterium]